VIVGDYTYGAEDIHIHGYGETDPADITIGKFCSIANAIEFLPGGMHQIDRVSTFPFQRIGWEYPAAYHKGPIRIGNDVWIGRGARILGGVTIGNGAIIGAYAVVASDVPHYHVAVGNPARCRPRPLHHPWADVLDRIAWWDWPAGDSRLVDVARLPVDEFCRLHG
jgi:acetyltransferase-like isoleucine patch superfamily enzyme